MWSVWDLTLIVKILWKLCLLYYCTGVALHNAWLQMMCIIKSTRACTHASHSHNLYVYIIIIDKPEWLVLRQHQGEAVDAAA